MRGRVGSAPSSPVWRVFHPDGEHSAATSYLRELSASDCSPLTLRSYAFDLLRWFRFIDGRHLEWQRAERVDVRAFIEHLRSAPVVHGGRRSAGLSLEERASAHPGEGERPPRYAARTINHQLSVLFGFYEYACAADLGPLVNPVPAQRSRTGGRLHDHHNPMESFTLHHRATYRQKTPRPTWRGIPDDAAEALFAALPSNRDRALVSFYLSSGVRASELLGLRHGDLDAGRCTITVTSKGTRARDTVPAAVDSFVWLALYMAEQPPITPGGPVWWTRRPQPTPLTYHAMRAVLRRANARLGTNWSLHDFRHTAAHRLLADPTFTLVDVQTILRHASITTTQIYTQPRLEDLVEKMLEHFARPSEPVPTIEPNYQAESVRELLGLPPT
ncbi:tyrosine-type recombinase/integrase [Skermania sp. ID1734]|uniref:tyrosine-type recombinase/integrase n=1 Tax=Skermania sp. ID1734 TaxID=2597516 RepID=UPI0021036D4E|nr:tyrosine-type recombinase/integrase [Skermania sp. ID1734]